MNWASGFARMRLAGIAGLAIGLLLFLAGAVVSAYSLPSPLFIHGALGIPFIAFGLLLWVLGWIGEGFVRSSRRDG